MVQTALLMMHELPQANKAPSHVQKPPLMPVAQRRQEDKAQTQAPKLTFEEHKEASQW